MKKILIGSFTAMIFLPGLLLAEELKTARVKIEGMTCGMCAKKVESQLSSLCKEVKVDREKGEGVCKYAPPTTPEQIVAEANKAGFKTTVLQ